MSLTPAFEIGIWNGWIFMIWLILQTLAARLISKDLYSKAGDPSDMKPSLTRRITSYVSQSVWLLGSVYSIFLPLQLGTIWFCIGLLIFLVGLVVLTIASFNFATTPIDEPITQGIYRYSRHPVYMAILLIYLSVGIASISWIFLLIAVVWLILIPLAAVDEERYCLEKYGNSYRDYMNRVPRWIGIPKSGSGGHP